MFQPVAYGNIVIVGVVIFSLGSGVLYTVSLFYTSNLIIQLKVRKYPNNGFILHVCSVPDLVWCEVPGITSGNTNTLPCVENS